MFGKASTVTKWNTCTLLIPWKLCKNRKGKHSWVELQFAMQLDRQSTGSRVLFLNFKK